MINNFEKKEIDQKRNMHKRNRSDKNMHKIKKIWIPRIKQN